MGVEKEPHEQHVPTTTLWDYRTQNRLLFRDEILHLFYGCNDCLSRLRLCELSQSFEEVARRATMQGARLLTKDNVARAIAEATNGHIHALIVVRCCTNSNSNPKKGNWAERDGNSTA